jgi:hypothetical protein
MMATSSSHEPFDKVTLTREAHFSANRVYLQTQAHIMRA